MLSDVSILIVIKNIISTARTETKITVISLDVSSIKEDILSSPIGSTIAAPILYTIIIENIFIIGTRQIPISKISPILPKIFFINSEDDNNMSTESDTKLPITGIKLPTANLALFTVNLSNDVTYIPCIDIRPK